MLDFLLLQPDDSDVLLRLIDIYQEAIEPSEQKSAADLRRMLGDPRYALIVCREAGKIQGFSIAHFPAAGEFWLLEYMAVSASARSRGVGAAIFINAQHYGIQRDPSRVCVLEVDRLSMLNTTHNDTQARLRFYGRLGCRAVQGVDYILPLDTGGTPPPMFLLTYHQPPLASLRREQLRLWLSTLYAEVYGKSPEDPRIDVMTSHLGDTVPVVALN